MRFVKYLTIIFLVSGAQPVNHVLAILLSSFIPTFLSYPNGHLLSILHHFSDIPHSLARIFLHLKKRRNIGSCHLVLRFGV